MNERMDRCERMIEAIIAMQADAEIRSQDADKRQAEADKQMKQLRRILVSAIRIGRRDRSKLTDLLNAVTASQLRLETIIQRHDERITRLENPN